VVAAQANGQIGAAQTEQLLKIRALLVFQSNLQVKMDREARETEAGARLRGSTFVKGEETVW
jgi:conjugal transfer/entry exclusion protein